MLGHSMLEFMHPDDSVRTLAAAQEINDGAVKLDFENRYIRKDGTVVHLLWSARWSDDKQQRVAVARDISSLKLTQRRQAALYEISEAAFGAEDIDQLYQQIHQIIAGLMPVYSFVIARYDAQNGMSFGYNSTAARFGGDEFVILLEQVTSETTAVQLAENIRQALCQPYLIDGQQLSIQPSIGIALYPLHGTSQQELVLNADQAMYQAKKAGGNRLMLSDGKLLLNRVAN